MKQHFVPQFCLKKFSNDNDGKSISVFLKNTSEFIQSASIKGQSQKINYYGKDQIIENYLMGIETRASIVFNKICQNEAIIKEPFEDYFRILHFAINLYFRNPVQSELILNHDANFNDHYEKYKDSPEIKSLIDNKITPAQSIGISLTESPRIAKMCADLSCKLIINKSSIPFITSDNPVVKYNSFSDRLKNISASFVSYGLQIFFPLSPTLMLLYYDPKAYTIKEDEKDLIFITEESEILQLNLLQVLNSSNCLYFNTTIADSTILSLASQLPKYTVPNQITPIEFGSYFFQVVSEVKIDLKLSCMQVLDYPNAITGQMILPMRPFAKKMRDLFEKENEHR